MIDNAPGKPRPRVLFVVNVSWFFVSHRMELARRIAAEGFEVHVVTRVTDASDADRIRAAGLVLHDRRIGRGDTGPLSDLRSLFGLWSLMRALAPDLVHLVTVKPIVVGGIAARFARPRAIVAAASGLGHAFTDTGWWPALRRHVVVFAIRFVVAHRRCLVICQNADDLALLVRVRAVRAEQARLIRGAGVDLDQFAVRAEAAGPLRVLLASRMLRSKGILEFVGAARSLAPRWPQVEFLLAGDVDPENPASLARDEVRALTGGTVRWLGHVDDVAALMASVHVVVLASHDREGLPKVLIEAAAAGRPIVATDIPGCREVVNPGVNGLLVAPRDASALASAIESLLGDASLRARMGAAGRDMVERELSLDHVVRQTLDVYREALGRP
jgi:glycosyltransferase involved in cell wall biosynthesis